jgi:hypothetical protein
MLIYLQGKFHPNWLRQIGGIPTKLQKFKIITPTVVKCLGALGPKHKKLKISLLQTNLKQRVLDINIVEYKESVLSNLGKICVCPNEDITIFENYQTLFSNFIFETL